MTAKRGALHASRNRMGRTGQPQWSRCRPGGAHKGSERKALKDCGAIRAGGVATCRQRIDPKRSDVHPVRSARGQASMLSPKLP